MKTNFRICLAIIMVLIMVFGAQANAQRLAAHFFYWYDAPNNNVDPARMAYHPPGLSSPYNGTYYSSLSIPWYEWQLNDMKAAGVDIAAVVTWGERHQPNFFKQSVLSRMVTAIRNTNSPIKIACYDDTTSEVASWNADNGRGYVWSETYDNLKLSCAASNASWYFYNDKIKPFFQLIPRDLWATHNGLPVANGGRPIIFTYVSYYYKDLWNAHNMWQSIKNAFYNDFGVQPFLIPCWSWFHYNSNMYNVADGMCIYGAATSGILTYTVNGYTVSNLGPGRDDRPIGGPNYRPRWSNYSGGDDGLDEQWFRENFQAVPTNANLVLVESWNELWEGTAFSRCNDFPKRTGGYTTPNYYMDVSKQQIMAARDRAGVPSTLQNGGMETYTNGVANSWTPFWLYGNVTYGAETTYKYSGSNAQRLTSVWEPHLAGVLQRVTATSGTKYTASVHSWRSDPWNNTNINEETWIGIDPAGGVDPTASTIVWSSSKHSYRTWTQQVVTAQATSNRITVFLRARANYGGSDMRAVFDNVTLSTTTLGTISGVVRDTSNNPINGATVSTTGYSTTTNSSGAYTLSNVNPGEYTVTSSRSGYASQAHTVLVTNGATVTQNFNLATAATEKVQNWNMEGGFFNTGWGSNCSSRSSALPNPSGVWGWNNEPSYPFNTFQETTIRRGSSSLGFAFCATAASPGKMGIAWQSVNLGSANATATFSVWAYHTDGNCPSIMCWNPGQNQSNPYTANSAGRYQWVTTDNWGQRNMWLNRSMTVQADSSGYVTIMVGGAAHPGIASGAKLYIDDVSVK